MMAKFVASVVLFVAAVFCVEGIRIPPPTQSPGDSHVEPVYPNILRNDPRCAQNGMFPNPEDCYAYYVCVDGTSQQRKCPGTSKYDSLRQCTYAEDADCGVGRADAGLSCPEDYGIFPYEEDCHKYILCLEKVPQLKTCPEKQWYEKHVGCVEGDKCPRTPSGNSISDVIDN